jgi:hypothetical protein
MPEEPAEAEDGNRGGGGDKGRARKGHCAIPVLDIGLKDLSIGRLDYQLM